MQVSCKVCYAIPCSGNGIRNIVLALSLERGVVMRYPKRAFSRDKRKEQVVGQFAIWYSKGDEEPKTMTRIARALGMTPQKRVTELLDEMVMEGKATVEQRDKSGRWTGNYYLVIKSLITEKYLKGNRRFVVKRRGVVVDSLSVPEGQLGLF